MAKKKTPTKKPTKRRRSHDPALPGFKALQHLIAQTEGRAQPAINIAKLKADFHAAHAHGMKALSEGDMAAFSEAVDRERKIADEWDSAIKAAIKHNKTP
jgi:hypothetical protein